jgi:hypothetical protein
MATRLGHRRPAARLRCDALETRVTPASVRVIDFDTGFVPYRMTGVPFARFADGDLILTDGPYQQLTAWTKTRVDVRAFHTSFVFRQGGDNPDEYWAKGDGFTFALAGSDYPFSGVAGGGLGYQGLTNSVAVKFDLVDNAGEGSNSVGVYTGGAAPTTPAVSLDGTGIDLHSGHPFRADIAYDGGNLILTLTDTSAPDRAWTGGFAVDIPGALGASTGYAGFTAGTGELFTRQSIRSWTYAEDPPPAPTSRPPTIVPATETHYQYGTSIALTADVVDDRGPAGLTYTWTAASAPGGAAPRITPTPSPEDPSSANVALDRGGVYSFRLTVRNAEGQAATSLFNYVILQSTDGMEVFPRAATVPAGGTVQFVAALRDQFGNPRLNVDQFWQITSGRGFIDASGQYTAPADASGEVTVEASVRLTFPLPSGSDWLTVKSKVLVLAPRPSGGGVVFGGGFDGAELNQNGSAHVADGRLRLTDSPYQAGSAFAPAPVDVRGFNTSFRFQIGDVPRSIYGDGLTFVIQNAGPGAVGVAGGGLGYQGIGQSVAVKFDLVDNAGEGPDSVGVFTSGAAPTTPADTYGPGFYDPGTYLSNVRVFQADLSYSGGTLLLDLLDTRSGQRFSRTYTVDIPAAIGGPTAYVGFTAGTGELSAPIDILGWTYTPTTDASGNATPLIAEGPRADPGYVRGTSTQLSARAADDGPEPDLTYTWEVLAVPTGAGPVRFSDNGTNSAKVTTATFDRTGRYTFRLTVTDAQGNATRSAPVGIEVAEVLGAFTVTPAAPTVMSGGAVPLAFQYFDQFGDELVGSPGGWGFAVDGPGYIDSGYRYVAPQTWTGTVTIRATNGTVSGAATVKVVGLAPATTAGFEFFDPAPRLVVNGSAIENSGTILTTDVPDRAGSAFHATPLDVTGFVTRFRLRLGLSYATPNLGAGIAFVIQGIAPTAGGAAGPGFGYRGIDRSAAVTFDPAANAIGLATNGAAPAATFNLAGTGIDLRGGHILEADLFYDGATLAVTVTDTETGTTTTAPFAVDIPRLVGGPTAFVGFTGATGPVVDPYVWQQVFDWRYQTVSPGTPNEPPAIIRPARLVASAFYATDRAYPQLRAADDGGPFNLRTRWELVSGPPGAAPRFEPSPSPGNYAKFDMPGTYLFRVTVTDSQGQSAVDYATYVVESAS